MSTERKLSKKSDRPFYTRLDRTGRWIRGGSDKAAPPPLIKLEIFPFSNSSVIVYWYLNTYPIHWPIQLFIYWKWWIKWETRSIQLFIYWRWWIKWETRSIQLFIYWRWWIKWETRSFKLL
jgi:hypothetical protein